MEGTVLEPADQVAIVRQHTAFVICDRHRFGALNLANEAVDAEARFVQVSFAAQLWQLQQELLAPLIERIKAEAQQGYDVKPVTAWLEKWVDNMRRDLPPLGKLNDSLMKEIGKRNAKQIFERRVKPGLMEVQREVEEAMAREPEGVLADLTAAAPHDELLEEQGPLDPSEANVAETDRIRLRKFDGDHLVQPGADVDWTFYALDEAGNETGLVGLRSNQTLSETLTDQYSRVVLIGPDEPPYYYLYGGRYFVADSIGTHVFRAIEDLALDPVNKEETRAFVDGRLPSPRSVLERCIVWANDPDNDMTTFDDVLLQIEIDAVEDDEAALAARRSQIRDEVVGARERGELSASQLSRCLAALGDKPSSREAIPKDVQSFVWNRDGGCCVECRSNENLEFDHIVPFSKGGSNTARNLQLLCEGCNRAKGARI